MLRPSPNPQPPLSLPLRRRLSMKSKVCLLMCFVFTCAMSAHVFCLLVCFVFLCALSALCPRQSHGAAPAPPDDDDDWGADLEFTSLPAYRFPSLILQALLHPSNPPNRRPFRHSSPRPVSMHLLHLPLLLQRHSPLPPPLPPPLLPPLRRTLDPRRWGGHLMATTSGVMISSLLVAKDKAVL